MQNTDTLALVLVDFLAFNPLHSLSYKTKMVKQGLCTIFLDSDGASDNHDLVRLYTLLFVWLNKHINQHLCKDVLIYLSGFLVFLGNRT